MWLHLTPTNSDPRVVVSYFISCVEKFRGVYMHRVHRFVHGNVYLQDVHESFGLTMVQRIAI